MTVIFKVNYFPCVHFAVRKFYDLSNHGVLLRYVTLSMRERSFMKAGTAIADRRKRTRRMVTQV